MSSHELPIRLVVFAGGQYVARAKKACTHGVGVEVADELHMLFECSTVQPDRQQSAFLFWLDKNRHHEVVFFE